MISFERVKARLGLGSRGSSERIELVSDAAPVYHHSGDLEQPAPSAPAPEASRSAWGGRGVRERGALGLLERSNPNKGIERFGLPLFQTAVHYIWNDLFTTLLTCPRGRFIIIFFLVYFVVYFAFALLYILWPGSCMNNNSRDFGHAFWFSFNTASTIGYSGDLYPNPSCNLFYLLTMTQIITATMLDYCLMGVVFARFAAPMPKAQAIRFSSNAVLFQKEGRGLWCLSFRLANIRKNSLLQPQISLVLAVPEGSNDSPNPGLRFLDLDVDDGVTQVVNIKLGLPATVTHIVTRSSPLFNLSLEQMEAQGMEVFCFLDGMDPMTSNSLQARHSYRPSDIRINERFAAIELQANWRGQVGLDFTMFDETAAAPSTGADTSNGTEPGFLRVSELVNTDPAVAARLRSQALSSTPAPDSGEAASKLPPPAGWKAPTQGAAAAAAWGYSHGTSNGGGGSSPEQQLGQAPAAAPSSTLALVEAVLGDAGSSPELRRFAALARSELLGSSLLEHLQ